MTVIGALSSFHKPGEMSPHKRAYGKCNRTVPVRPDCICVQEFSGKNEQTSDRDRMIGLLSESQIKRVCHDFWPICAPGVGLFNRKLHLAEAASAAELLSVPITPVKAGSR